MNHNDDKIRNTAWYSQPEATSWGTFRLVAPSCSGFLAWIIWIHFKTGILGPEIKH